MLLTKILEVMLSRAAALIWPIFQFFNMKIGKPSPSFQPKWAPAPLLKSDQRSTPQLGWPRETDSLCPKCVKEAREEILSGQADLDLILKGHPGEIKAKILERDGRILMEKECPRHGTFTDVMSIDPKFLERIERLFPGRDFHAITDLHNHGTSSVKYGRGTVLTVDLTNRCIMM
jgi:uncharacterized radical SAM superfamily Fe-S cluster-containing enzyme